MNKKSDFYSRPIFYIALIMTILLGLTSIIAVRTKTDKTTKQPASESISDIVKGPNKYHVDDVFFKTESVEKTIDYYQQQIANASTPDLELKLKLAEFLLQAGRPTQAIPQLKRALQLSADPKQLEEIRYKLGLAFEQLGQLEKAMSVYRNVLTKNPGNRQVYQRLMCLELLPKSSRDKILRAWRLYHSKEYVQALKIMGKLNERSVYAEHIRGLLWLKTGHICKAIKHLTHVIWEEPKFSLPFHQLRTAMLRRPGLKRMSDELMIVRKQTEQMTEKEDVLYGIKKMKVLIKRYPWRSYSYGVLGEQYKKIGLELEGQKQQRIKQGIIDALIYSKGDATNYENAKKVMNIIEEYRYCDALGYDMGVQSLDWHQDRFYDVLETYDLKTKKIIGFYFDISYFHHPKGRPRPID